MDGCIQQVPHLGEEKEKDSKPQNEIIKNTAKPCDIPISLLSATNY